jgi:hypothetical protein
MNKQPVVKIGEGLLFQIGEKVELVVANGNETTNIQDFKLDIPKGTRHIWISSVTEDPDSKTISNCSAQDGKLCFRVTNTSFCFGMTVTFFGLDFCGCAEGGDGVITIHKTEGISGFPILIDKFEGEVPTGKDLSISYKSQNGFDEVWIQPIATKVCDIKVTNLDDCNITISGSNNGPPFKLIMRFYVL